MLPFFTKAKNEKAARLLEQKLLEKLRLLYPDVYENHQYWLTKYVTVKNNTIRFWHYSNQPAYVEKNMKRHSKVYNLRDLIIHRANVPEPVSFSVHIELNLIASVQLPTDGFYKAYDLDSINVERVIEEEIIYEHTEEKDLMDILDPLSVTERAKLEIQDTYEFDLEGRTYHTILDMEDGNYIAVDGEGVVYRLHHDSKERAKEIAPSVESFLSTYSGNKASLAYLFD